MGRAIVALWAATLLLGFIAVGWWIFGSGRPISTNAGAVAQPAPLVVASPTVAPAQAVTPPTPPMHRASARATNPDRQECSGIFIKAALPVEDNGDEKQRCFPGLNPGSPEVCTDPRPAKDSIFPSQIWTNRQNGKQTVCEHGGYCYPMDAVKLNAACNAPGAVARYGADPGQ